MKNLFFITGTGSGLGKAIALELLKDLENYVIGISRSDSIQAENFRFVQLDLAEPDQVKDFDFASDTDPQNVFLINNAGIISEIDHLGKLSQQNIIHDFHVNLVSPSLLMNAFLKRFNNTGKGQFIVNISSGAGRNPVDGWSVYCASKAGLDMISRAAEADAAAEKLQVKTVSIAPGIIDTGMQQTIRSSSSGSFSRVEQFKEYFEKGELADPGQLAVKMVSWLKKLETETFPVIYSIRDFNE